MNRVLFSVAALLGALMPLVFDSALKGVALLAVATLCALLLGRASAATRHLVWLVAIVALLVVPVLSVALPQWRVLPGWAVVRATPGPSAEVRDRAIESQPTPESGMVVAPPLPQTISVNPLPIAEPPPRPALAVPSRRSEPPRTWRDWLAPAWAVGFTILALRLVAAHLLLRRAMCGCVIVRATPDSSETDDLTVQLHAASTQLGIRQRVTLLLDEKRTIPVVWGVFRPRLLLPAESLEWSDDQLRSVLLHELAHIKRRDTLVQWLTQIACALHWWNPLVWLAAWRLHVERERACDDLVLASGIRPSAYAEHLLRVATKLSPARWTQACGLAMARKSSLESRLLAVLSEKLNRRGVSSALAAIALILGISIAIPVAMLRAADAAKARGRILDRNGVVLAESAAPGMRTYPFQALAGHVIGYTRSPDDAARPVSLAGRDGVEKIADGRLSKGEDVRLTLDARFQSLVERTLIESGVGRASVVLLDLKSGGVLASASIPCVDSTALAGPVAKSLWDEWSANESKPLVNRSQIASAPGSIFKLVTAAAAARAGISEKTVFNCSGSVTYGNRAFRCWIGAQGGSHGKLDLGGAIKASCNCYFYQLAEKVGLQQLDETAHLLGLGERSLAGFPDEASGFIPSAAWAKEGGIDLSPGFMANTGIGQGYVTATPLQLATLTGFIATAGRSPRTHLMLPMEGELGVIDLGKSGLPPEAFSAIREAMVRNVNEDGGTGKQARSAVLKIAGKTGSVQHILRTKQSGQLRESTGWFVAYAPADAPKFSIAVMVEGGKSGGGVCAPIARRILERAIGELPAPQAIEATKGHLDPVETVRFADSKTTAESDAPTANANGASQPSAHPKHKDSRALYEIWQHHARANGDIPGALVGQLAAKVDLFIKQSPNHESTPPLAALRPKLDATRDWTQEEAAAVLDEIAGIATAPLKWASGIRPATDNPPMNDEALEWPEDGSGRPQARTMKPGTENALTWGEPVSGLRAALVRLPTEKEPAAGTVMDFNIVVQNISEAPVKLRTFSPMAASLEAHLADGTTVKVPQTTRAESRMDEYTLQPRQVAVMSLFAVGTGERDVNAKSEHRRPVGYWVPGGKAIVRFTTEATFANPPPGFWSGTLEAPFVLAPGETAPAPAPNSSKPDGAPVPNTPKTGDAGPRRKVDWSNPPPMSFFEGKYDPELLTRLVAKPDKDGEEIWQLSEQLLRAVVEKDPQFRQLLTDEKLKAQDIDSRILTMSLAAYDYSVFENRNAIKVILDQLESNHPEAYLAAFPLGFLDEWVQSIPAMQRCFARADGAKGEESGRFWIHREWLFPDSFAAFHKKQLVANRLDAESLRGVWNGSKDGVNVTLRFGENQGWEVQQGEETLRSELSTVPARNAVLLDLVGPDTDGLLPKLVEANMAHAGEKTVHHGTLRPGKDGTMTLYIRERFGQIYTGYQRVNDLVLTKQADKSKGADAGQRRKIDWSKGPSWNGLSEPFDPAKALALANAVKKSDSDTGDDRRRLMFMILQATAERAPELRPLLEDKALKLKDDDFHSLDLALAAYDFAVNGKRKGLQFILDSLASGPAGDVQAAVPLGFIDEWDLSVAGHEKHFDRGSDGAAGEARMMFWEERKFFFPESFARFQKAALAARKLDAESLNGTWKGAKDGVTVELRLGKEQRWEVRHGDNLLKANLVSSPAETGEFIILCEPSEKGGQRPRGKLSRGEGGELHLEVWPKSSANRPYPRVSDIMLEKQAPNTAPKPAGGAKLDAATEAQLDWGETAFGLRGALMIRSPGAGKPEGIYLVLQNVTDAPRRFMDTTKSERLRTLYVSDTKGVLFALSNAEPTMTDVTLQPREVVFLNMMLAESSDGEKLHTDVMIEGIRKDTLQTWRAVLDMSFSVLGGAWSGKLTTGETRCAVRDSGPLPKHASAQVLFKRWQSNARLNGEIPGGLLRLLHGKVTEFMRANAADTVNGPAAGRLRRIEPRFANAGGWKAVDVVTLLDDIAAVSPIPLDNTLRHLTERTLYPGTPLPASLEKADWGEPFEPHDCGLRAAFLLEPLEGTYRLGTEVKARILLHNSGKEAVAFATTSFQQPTHKATLPEGRQLNIDTTFWTTVGRPVAFRLEPGEYCELSAPGIGIGAQNNDGEDWANVRAGSWIRCKADDVVLLYPGKVSLSANGEQGEAALRWWQEFVAERLDREAPVPVDQREREYLLYRVVRELFGTAPSVDEGNSFAADSSPNALRNLAAVLAKRKHVIPTSDAVVPGLSKFVVLPPDADADKRPRVANSAGRYSLTDNVKFTVTSRAVVNSVQNEGSIVFVEQGKDAVVYKVALPYGHDTWAAGMMKGAKELWVSEFCLRRKLDFSNPLKIVETRYEGFDTTSAPIPKELRGVLDPLISKPVPGAPKAKLSSPPPATAPATEKPKGAALTPAELQERYYATRKEPLPVGIGARAVLIRSLTLEIAGELPTMEERMAFENDKAPDALGKVIARLVAKSGKQPQWLLDAEQGTEKSEKPKGVDTPGAATPEIRPKSATVEIGKDGSLRLDGEALALDALKAATAQQSGRAFVVREEKDVPFAKVQEVVEVLKNAGVKDVTFANAQAVKLTPEGLLSTWRGTVNGEKLMLSFHRPPVEKEVRLDVYEGDGGFGLPAAARFDIAEDGNSVLVTMHSADSATYGTLRAGDNGTLKLELHNRQKGQTEVELTRVADAAVKLTPDALLGAWSGTMNGKRLLISFHRPPVETEVQLDIYTGDATIGALGAFTIAPDGTSVALGVHDGKGGQVPFGTLHPIDANTLRLDSRDKEGKAVAFVVLTGGKGAPATEPEQKEARALFEMWKATANADGTIPGTFIGMLATEVRAYVKANPNLNSEMELPKLLPRFVTTRDWTRAEAIKLLDDVAYYSTAPIEARVAKAKLGSGPMWRTMVEFQDIPVAIAKWSEAKDGLRIGTRVVGGQWSVGGSARVELWLDNASGKDVVFRTAGPNRQDVEVMFSAIDAEGNEHSPEINPTSLIASLMDCTLPAAHVAMIKEFDVTFADADNDVSTPMGHRFRDLKPGKYQLRCKWFGAKPTADKSGFLPELRAGEHIELTAPDFPFTLGGAAAEAGEAKPTPKSGAANERVKDQPRDWKVRVVDGSTGREQAGVTVAAWVFPREGGQGRRVEHVADGRDWAIKLADNEHATLACEDAVWVGGGGSFHIGHLPPENPNAVGDREGARHTDPDKSFELRVWRGASVEGRVLLPGGKPAVGVQVMLGARIDSAEWIQRLGVMNMSRLSFDHGEHPNWHSVTMTNERGEFAGAMPPSEACTFATITCRTKDALTYEGKWQSIALALKNDPAHAGDGKITIQLEAGVRVHGRVVDTDGKPVARAEVFASGQHRHENTSAQTDAEGRYELRVRPGVSRVSVDIRERNEKGEVTSHNATGIHAPENVTIPEGATEVARDFRIMRVTDAGPVLPPEGKPQRARNAAVSFQNYGKPIAEFGWIESPWGPAKDGLSMALELDTNKTDQWRACGSVHGELYVRNNSAVPVEFPQNFAMHVGLAVTARDKDGKNHPARITMWEGCPALHHLTLPPGHAARVKIFTLQLDAPDSPERKTGASLELAPGKYKLRARWGDAHAMWAHEGEWTGTLESGEVDFTVAAPTAKAADGTKPTPNLAKLPDDSYAKVGVPIGDVEAHVVWSGVEQDGLCLGMRIAEDAEWRIGGEVKVELWACSNGEKDVKFQYCPRRDIGLRVFLKGADGTEHRADIAFSNGLPVFSRALLPAGHIFKVKEFSVVLQPPDKKAAGLEPHFKLPPGDYKFRTELTLPGTTGSGDGNQVTPPEGEWTGTLKSGELDVKLVAAEAPKTGQVPNAKPEQARQRNDKYAAVAYQTANDVNFVLIHEGFISTGLNETSSETAASDAPASNANAMPQPAAQSKHKDLPPRSLTAFASPPP